MITTQDFSYIDTKRVKEKRKVIPSEFTKLMNWISDKYDVTPINVCYETLTSGIPRLEIIFEEKEEDNFFRGEYNLFYDEIKQKEIKEAFVEIVSCEDEKNHLKYNLNRLLIITSAFKPVAVSAANNNITKEQINKFKVQYQSYGLWEISRFFSAVTFFFYTDKQMQEFKQSGAAEAMRLDYFSMLKQYDVFDYIQKKDFQIFFDSKENLDKNFQGSLQYYYR